MKYKSPDNNVSINNGKFMSSQVDESNLDGSSMLDSKLLFQELGNQIDILRKQAKTNEREGLDSEAKLFREYERRILEQFYTSNNSAQRLEFLFEFTKELKGQYSLSAIVDTTLEAITRRMTSRFAVLILGERELGPYYYYGMRGEQTPWRYLLYECPFPLSGSLAQAILRRRKPDEPDYLRVNDLSLDNRPRSEEFPWLPHEGSLLFVPLRFSSQATGALMLGHYEAHGFDDDALCQDFYDIAAIVAEAIHHARMHQEMISSAEKLVNSQILTREIANVNDYHQLITILTDQLSEVSGNMTVEIYLEQSFQYPDTEKYTTVSLPNHSTKLYLVSAKSNSNTQAHHSDSVLNLIEWVIDAGQPIFYDPEVLETQTENPLYNESGAAMIVPIIDGRCTYGVMHLTMTTAQSQFNESDMIVLRTIANSTASAFAKLQLIQTKENSLLCAVQPMVDIVESRFISLHGHSGRTAHNAAQLAKQVGLADAECVTIRIAASLHDIGMTCMPDSELEFLTSSSGEPVPISAIHSLQKSHYILNRASFNPSVTDIIDNFANICSYKSHKVGNSTNVEMAKVRPGGGDYNLSVGTLNKANSIRSGKNYIQEADVDSSNINPVSIGKTSNIFNEEAAPVHRGNTLPNETHQGIGADLERAAQIVAISEAVDEFLICASSEESSIELAYAFLDQAIGSYFDKQLIIAYQILLEQELILLP